MNGQFIFRCYLHYGCDLHLVCILMGSSLFTLSLDIAEDYDVLITSSVDCTVRMWTMEGHFIGNIS